MRGRGDWGHFAVAGLLRELVHETTAAQPTVTGLRTVVDDSTWTGSLSASGKFMFGKDDLRWMLLYGNLGRYVGLNFANDAVLDADGNLESIDGWAGFVAYRHLWTDKWRSTFQYSMQDYDNDASLTGVSDALSPNKSSNSWVVNLFYTPIPKLDLGAEYRHGTRELENGSGRQHRPVTADHQVLVLISRAAWIATRRVPPATRRPRTAVRGRRRARRPPGRIPRPRWYPCRACPR